MDNKFIGLMVGLTVGVLMVSGFLWPIVSDATATESTFKNTGAFFVEVDPTDTYTISYDNAVANNVITVNGTAITLNRDYSIIALENAILRINADSHKLDWNGNGQYIAGINALNITISAGTISGVYKTTGEEVAWPAMTYTKCYVISPTDQDLIMSEYNTPVKVKGDDEIVAFGRTVLNDAGTNKQFLIQINGTINDGVTVTVANVSSGQAVDATISDLQVNTTEIEGYENLYELTSITFKAALGSSPAGNVTYTAYIVPAEVTAEKSWHLDTTQIALVAAIGTLGAIVLIAAAAGSIRRLD